MKLLEEFMRNSGFLQINRRFVHVAAKTCQRKRYLLTEKDRTICIHRERFVVVTKCSSPRS